MGRREERTAPPTFQGKGSFLKLHTGYRCSSVSPIRCFRPDASVSNLVESIVNRAISILVELAFMGTRIHWKDPAGWKGVGRT